VLTFLKYMEKILILGGNSKLARCFFLLYPKITKSLTKKECDITSKNDVEKVIINTSAKYILNCAAITDIEYCENNKDKCLNVNTFAVNCIESVCKKYNKKLIHITSDYALNPVNYYGFTKYLNEKQLDKSKSLIIRTSFYSKQLYLVRELLNHKEVTAYTNVFFNPVSINRLAKEIFKKRNKYGILNVFSNSKVSKYEFAIQICKTFGINTNLVKPAKFKNTKGSARRPFNSFVNTEIKINTLRDLKHFKFFTLKS